MMDIRLGDMVLVNSKWGLVPALLIETTWDKNGLHLKFDFAGEIFDAIPSDVRPLCEIVNGPDPIPKKAAWSDVGAEKGNG
jgi:hypothetical protein